MPDHEITRLLSEMSGGDSEAASRLIPLVYGELRRLAGGCMQREGPGHTLQATALVHEAFLRLVDQREVTWQNRAHFIGVAAQAMRRILVDYARARSAAKRGGGLKVTLVEGHAIGEEKVHDLLVLDEALTRLAEIDERQARIVELRFLGGLEVQEAAEVVGISPATVKREWAHARAWLQREMKRHSA